MATKKAKRSGAPRRARGLSNVERLEPAETAATKTRPSQIAAKRHNAAEPQPNGPTKADCRKKAQKFLRGDPDVRGATRLRSDLDFSCFSIVDSSTLATISSFSFS